MFGYLLLFLTALIFSSIASYVVVNEMVEERVEKELTITADSITNNITTTANITIRNYLRSISELNYQYIEQQYQRYLKGVLTEQKAKQNISHHFAEQVIGSTGYPYIADSKGVIRVHPQTELVGQSLLKHAFMKEQVKRRTGYTEYEWKNPGEKESRSKALHMIYFEPWDWIITSSSYRDEFISLINIDDFNEFISTMRFNHSGYSYVMNGAGDFIVHPFFQGNFYSKQDSEGKLFVQDILNKKNGRINYTWRNPHETEFRDKVAVFRHIPELEWYVVASTYLDELYQPLQKVNVIHGLVLLLSIIVVVPLTMLLSRSIVVPLKGIMKQLKSASSGHYSTRIEEQNGSDELAQLSRYFNQFMMELELSSQKLHGEIQERKEAQRLQVELNSKLEDLNKNLEETVSERTMALKQSMVQLQQTQQQLIESEKLSALGGLVAGVAHEVNTPLGIAVTATSVVSEVHDQLKQGFESHSLTKEQFGEYLSQQSKAVRLLLSNLDRAAKLIHDFKQTAVDQVSEHRSNFSVYTVLDALIASMHPELRKVPVRPQLLGDKVLMMSSFPGVLTQVFSNLILNSVNHAFAQTKVPQIAIEFESDEENIIFTYQDNGCGVPEALHKKIFEPFFTTRKGKGGTGLGLNLVFNLVTKKLKGSLNFQSTTGVEFKMVLPKQLPVEEGNEVQGFLCADCCNSAQETSNMSR